MADKITYTEDLVLVGEFKDGDDRTLTIPDPRVDVDDSAAMTAYAAQIDALAANIKAKKILIGDKAGADFLRFKDARIVKKTVVNFDLN